MKTVDELYDEIINYTKYLEIYSIEAEIKNEIIKRDKHCIFHIFKYVINDIPKQQAIIDELENNGYKITPMSTTEKGHIEIKIEWNIDNKNNDEKPHTIISAKEANDLFHQAISKHLVVKEIELINKEIKERASQCKNNIWHKWKFMVVKNDSFNIMKQLRELGYYVDEINLGECIFIEWR